MCCAAGRGEARRRVWPRSEGRTHAAKTFAADASQMQRAPHQAARSSESRLLHSLLRHTLEPRARTRLPPLGAAASSLRRLRLPASGRARPAGVSTPHAPRRRRGRVRPRRRCGSGSETATGTAAAPSLRPHWATSWELSPQAAARSNVGAHGHRPSAASNVQAPHRSIDGRIKSRRAHACTQMRRRRERERGTRAATRRHHHHHATRRPH
jgi:hypothetical protein